MALQQKDEPREVERLGQAQWATGHLIRVLVMSSGDSSDHPAGEPA